MLLMLLLNEYAKLTPVAYYVVNITRQHAAPTVLYFPKSKENLAYEIFYHYSHNIRDANVSISIVTQANLNF